MRRTVWLLALLFGIVQGLQAQGIVIDRLGRPAELMLRSHRVDASVEEQVAVVKVEHVFHNPGSGTVEGTFLFPLPPGAQVSRFSMTVDGREMAGELLDADEARRIYEDIVRRSLDPALLEMADYRTFRARVFPIPGGATRTITLRYDATLPRDGNTVTFQYPMQGSLATRHAGPPVPVPRPWPQSDGTRPRGNAEQPPDGKSEIRVALASATGLRNLYSPSHRVDVDQPDGRRAVVTFGGEQALDGRDFVLYYSLDPGEIGATMLAHRPYGDRPGYFMVLVSPQVDFDAGQVQPKDVVFVLDTSGSMAGEKIDQAKDALRYCLNRLGERDRFGLVAFSSDVDVFRDQLATPAARDDARYFVDQLEARGGTNIHAALLEAVAMLRESERGMIIFLTDGLPSSGVTDEGAIRKAVAEANTQGVRIFAFGVGYDVNTRLLDGLARESDAFADYISPEENIEERVGTFYDKVRYPVMTDLSFRFDGADAYAFAPAALPDLYRGGQIILAGRYRRPGATRLTLRGTIAGRERTLTYDFRLPEAERERDFIARLWATRRVGQLLDDLRLHGENAELKEEVIALAKEFGLVTPYTSYLVQEDESFTNLRPRRDGIGFQSAMPAPAAEKAMDATTGAVAVQLSRSIRTMQEAEVAPEAAAPGLVAVNGRTLRQEGEGAWMDVDFDAEKDEAVQIKFASEAYFAFLRMYPEARAFAKLGAQVTFRFGNGYVRIGEDGREQMSEAELRALAS